MKSKKQNKVNAIDYIVTLSDPVDKTGKRKLEFPVDTIEEARELQSELAESGGFDIKLFARSIKTNNRVEIIPRITRKENLGKSLALLLGAFCVFSVTIIYTFIS